MTGEQWLTIILSVCAIVVSALGMLLTYSHERGSRKNLTDSCVALENIKNTADSVKYDSRTFTTQLLNFVRVSLQGKGPEEWIRECCLHDYEVIPIEQAVRTNGSVYVLAVTMDYDVHQFNGVIADNLNQGKRYLYFLPEDMPAGHDNEKQRLIETLRLAGVAEQTLKKNLKMWKVRSGGVLCNVTLFDPEFGDRQGFLLPAYENTERAFSIRMDNTLHDRAWARIQQWRANKDATVIWPTS